MSKPIQTVEELDAVLHWRGKHAQAIRERDALQQDLNQRDEQIATLDLQREAHLRNSQVVERRVGVLEKALKFYAEREHYHFESGNWDTVSGEPLNILWNGDEPDFIEDGSVARSALTPAEGGGDAQ